MHLLRHLKVLRQLGRHDTGISEEAHQELAQAAQEVGLMRSMSQDFHRLRERASEIRERNGFEELMQRLLNEPGGGTKPHDNSR